MNIIVCVKQVPDTESFIKVKDNKVQTEDLNFVINPFDEFAIEECLKLKEKFGGKVIAISMGTERVTKALRSCLALGVDEAYYLNDPAFLDSDPLGVAKILCKACQKFQYDIIFFGKQGVDDDYGQTGIFTAELLNLPHVSTITKLEVSEDGKSAKAHHETDAGIEIVETSLPAVFTAQKGLNEPRYASMKGIIKAKKIPINTFNAADLGIDPSTVGAAARKINYQTVEKPPERKSGKVLTGEPVAVVKELVKLLKEEAKVL
ncbi:electron transfer flavoprotein subunit beta/FixA family protein [bacterium]|nr:electron transfer flavoprotein subunit beta/FixA family protein [bacterium]